MIRFLIATAAALTPISAAADWTRLSSPTAVIDLIQTGLPTTVPSRAGACYYFHETGNIWYAVNPLDFGLSPSTPLEPPSQVNIIAFNTLLSQLINDKLQGTKRIQINTYKPSPPCDGYIGIMAVIN